MGDFYRNGIVSLKNADIKDLIEMREFRICFQQVVHRVISAENSRISIVRVLFHYRSAEMRMSR